MLTLRIVLRVWRAPRYHMMPRELKTQLLSWAQRHRRDCKLVMISNRLDQEDIELFDSVAAGDRGDAAAAEHSPAGGHGGGHAIRIIQARGSGTKILSTMAYPEIRRQKPVRWVVRDTGLGRGCVSSTDVTPRPPTNRLVMRWRAVHAAGH